MTAPVVTIVDRWPERSQTFVSNELRALLGRGVPVRLFHLRDPMDPGDGVAGLDVERLVDPQAWDRTELLRRLSALVPRWGPGPLRALRLMVAGRDRGRPDACRRAVDLVARLDGPPARFHAHFANAPAGVAMMASALTGAPYSVTAHANDVFVRAQDLDAVLTRADVVVDVCASNREWLARHHPDPSTHVLVPCGIDTAAFTRARPRPHRPFTVVAVGRLVAKKGFDDLVRAAARLHTDGLDVQVRLVGDGRERPALEALRDDLGLDDVVTFVGSQPPEVVRDELEAASVLALPCVVGPDGDRDAQPLVVKEAMAMALPVVGTTAVGIPEMVVDGVTGMLVPPHDPDALADALAELAADPARCDAMGAAGRERVVAEFDLAVTIPRLLRAWGMDA